MSIGQVVSKALDKNPDERYQQVEELLDDLESISAGIIPEEIKVRLRKAKLHKRKRTIVYAGAAGLIIISAVLALTLFTGRAEAIDSIAVLPLKNLTGDKEQDYFVDGVTDELIGQLAQISGLRRVISRTTVMEYKGVEKPLPEIARELNVDAVVEGTVYQVGEKVRIRVRLIVALPEERNLWAETYERAGTDVLMMYSEMARTIADKIQVKLTSEEETRFASTQQVNPQAYEAYLKGLFHWYKLTPQDLETALQYFESALERDPDYALAYTGIALVWIGRSQGGGVLPSEAVPKAKDAAFKALELDNTLAEVHYTLALIRTWSDWDWEGAETAFLRALKLKPNYPDARVYYSNLLCYMGRPEEALEQGEQALKMDPYNSLFKGIYGLTLLMTRRYDYALLQARNALKISPTDLPALSILWEVMHLKGMYEEALTAAKAFYTGLGLAPITEAMEREYEKNGYSEAMNFAGNALAEISRETNFSPLLALYPYLYAGNKSKVFELLEKGYEIRDPNMPYIVEPIFVDLLGDEPRFQDLLRKMNLPAGK
jgi:TolB-like protein/Tfp pilus assembly protein PilF